MAYRYDYNPPPGKVTPEKYTKQGLPAPGANYMQLGEQPGYTYNPYDDLYHPSKEGQAAASGESTKETGLMSSLLPIAGASAAYAVGTGIAKDPKGYVGGIYDGIKDGYNGLFGTTPATTTGQTAGTTVAQQAAQTAAQAPVAQGAANTAAATGAPATPILVGAEYVAPQSEAAAAGTLGYAGAAAGAAAGAYGVHQMHSQGSYQSSPGEQGLQGAAAGAALGASAGSVVPGVGTVIGGAIGAVVGGLYGLGRGAFGDSNKWKTEKRKVERLNDAGVYIPPNLLEAAQKQKPRSLGTIQKETSEQLQSQGLPEDYVGFDKNGQWVNAQFAKTRDEKDLRPEDIVNFSAFAEHDTNWFQRPLQERLNVAKAALDAGAVAEGKGSLAVGFDKFDYATAANTPYGAAAGNPTLQKEQSASVGGRATKGTRLSPGVYADGRGGTYRK